MRKSILGAFKSIVDKKERWNRRGSPPRISGRREGEGVCREIALSGAVGAGEEGP